MTIWDQCAEILIVGVAAISLFLSIFFRLLTRVPLTVQADSRAFPYRAFSMFSFACFLYFSLYDLSWHFHASDFGTAYTLGQLMVVPFVATTFLIALERLLDRKPWVPYVWLLVYTAALAILAIPVVLGGGRNPSTCSTVLRAPAPPWLAAWLAGISALLVYLFAVVFRTSRPGMGRVRATTILLVALSVVDLVVNDIPPLFWIGVFAVYLSASHLLASEIGSLNKTNAVLHKQLILDALTGAYSRAYANAELINALGRLKRMPERLWLGMMDLDDFKGINDRYGHAAGDAALREVVKRLRTHLRPVDKVARVGGDEFLLFLEGNVDAANIGHVAERLLAGLRDKDLEFQARA